MELLDGAFGALADPIRRDVVLRLAHGPRPAGALARGYPVSRPAVSRHLRVLREAGLVTIERRGRSQIYHLAPGALTSAQDWLKEAERTWHVALQSFKQHVEAAK